MYSYSVISIVFSIFFFFFQAEDGIRDVAVTGVQTCALPIFHLLDGDTDDLVDGDDIAKFRANLKRLGIPFHVEASAVPADPDWNAEGHEVVRVTREQIADLVRAARRFIAF